MFGTTGALFMRAFSCIIFESRRDPRVSKSRNRCASSF
jgi:hypothetical protein